MPSLQVFALMDISGNELIDFQTLTLYLIGLCIGGKYYWDWGYTYKQYFE